MSALIHINCQLSIRTPPVNFLSLLLWVASGCFHLLWVYGRAHKCGLPFLWHFYPYFFYPFFFFLHSVLIHFKQPSDGCLCPGGWMSAMVCLAPFPVIFLSIFIISSFLFHIFSSVHDWTILRWTWRFIGYIHLLIHFLWFTGYIHSFTHFSDHIFIFILLYFFSVYLKKKVLKMFFCPSFTLNNPEITAYTKFGVFTLYLFLLLLFFTCSFIIFYHYELTYGWLLGYSPLSGIFV